MTKTSKISKTNFLTPWAKTNFLYQKTAFTKALTFHYFDLKSHIWIKIDVFGYAIGGIFSQLVLNQKFSGQVIDKNTNFSKFDQWHLINFFSRKIIPVETWYKTHNQELLGFNKVSKTWQHYLESCNYKIFVFINLNNL